MGCIEIGKQGENEVSIQGLIETWDVLKFEKAREIAEVLYRLIETWDVLK